MLAASNLKFLKLLPGLLSTFCGPVPAWNRQFSETVVAPSELFLAFHTLVPEKLESTYVLNESHLLIVRGSSLLEKGTAFLVLWNHRSYAFKKNTGWNLVFQRMKSETMQMKEKEKKEGLMHWTFRRCIWFLSYWRRMCCDPWFQSSAYRRKQQTQFRNKIITWILK